MTYAESTLVGKRQSVRRERTWQAPAVGRSVRAEPGVLDNIRRELGKIGRGETKKR